MTGTFSKASLGFTFYDSVFLCWSRSCTQGCYRVLCTGTNSRMMMMMMMMMMMLF